MASKFEKWRVKKARSHVAAIHALCDIILWQEMETKDAKKSDRKTSRKKLVELKSIRDRLEAQYAVRW